MIWRNALAFVMPYDPPVKVWSDAAGVAAVASGEFVEVYRDGVLVGWKEREAAGWSPYPIPREGCPVPEGAS